VAHIRFCTSNQRLSRNELVGNGAEFLDVIDGGLERCLLVGGELQFEDLFHSLASEDTRDADELSADAIFLVAIHGAGHDAFLIADDGFGHSRGG